MRCFSGVKHGVSTAVCNSLLALCSSPPTLLREGAVGTRRYEAEFQRNDAEAERLLKIIVQKERSGWFGYPPRDELSLASVLACDGKRKEAEEVYLSTLKRVQDDPRERETWYAELCQQNLGLFYLEEGRQTEARPLLKKVMLRHPDNGSWISVLRVDDYLKVLRRTGRADQAKAVEAEINSIGDEIRNELNIPHKEMAVPK